MQSYLKCTNERSFLVNERTSNFSSPVVITGASRGGTSLISSLFRAAGFAMGQGLGENHEDPVFHDALYPSFSAKKFQRALEIKRPPLWGFKLPKTAMLLSEVDDIIGRYNPTYIFVFRSPLAAALGEYLRGANFEISLYYSSVFYERISLFSKQKMSERNMIFCDYSLIAKDPRPFVEKLCHVFEIDSSSDKVDEICRVNTGEGGGYRAF